MPLSVQGEASAERPGLTAQCGAYNGRWWGALTGTLIFARASIEQEFGIDLPNLLGLHLQ